MAGNARAAANHSGRRRSVRPRMHSPIPLGARRALVARSLRSAVVLCAATIACSCGTLATSPPPLGAALAGQWQQDKATSDNFEAKLTPLIEAQRRRMMPRRGPAGAQRGGDSGGDAGANGDTPRDGIYPLMVPLEEADKVRARLGDELRPPATLLIAVDAEALELTPDAEPVRRFLTGQDVSRIDSSGAAILDSGWDQGTFVVRANYTNRSTRSWRYEVEGASGLLRVSFEANAPEFGKFSLQTRYRRVPPAPPGKN
jgi:hypothetical protein